MLNSSVEEYKMMYEAEEKLWWYRILHEKVLAEIVKKYRDNDNVSILDIGCGTGGLMSFLIKKGYQNIQGIDYSEAAIFFCKERKLNVQKLNIEDLNELGVFNKFDVIVCNDVFYCLERDLINKTFETIYSLLNTDGIFISNNNAFDVFWGTHDIAVGGKHRFIINDFEVLIPRHLLKIDYSSYWTWLLSPLVLTIRLSQRFGIKLGLIKTDNVVSDVEVPSNFVNNCCYKLVKFEEKLFYKGFFGSSLFMKISKHESSQIFSKNSEF